MATLYALVLQACLSSGQCYDYSPEVYKDMAECIIEASWQRKNTSNVNAYCEEMEEQ